MHQKGHLCLEDMDVVPDVYIRNQSLDQDVKHLRIEVERYRDAML